jgi:CRISPR/Cas system CSM-associated protein Csm4 (group 5 of RAMP superfamily)
LGSNFLYAGDSENVPFYVHALTVNSYIQSAYKCVKGGSQISKLLIKNFVNMEQKSSNILKFLN